MTVLAVDPGPEQSAWVLFDGARVLAHAIEPNADLLRRLPHVGVSEFDSRMVDGVVFEQIESFGMAVGREVFETVFWTGRFYQATNARVARMTRKAVKMNLCQSMRAKDANIRAALIDRFGGSQAIGRKAARGPLYGVRADEWSALAIAVTWCDLAKAAEPIESPTNAAAPESEDAREKGSRATAKRGTRKKAGKHDPEGEFSKQRQAGRAKAGGRGKGKPNGAAEATH